MEFIFASPTALWALLGLPLLVLANWLSGRYSEEVVPNLMIWRQLGQEVAASHRRSRRLRRLKLLLEVLLLTLLAVGAAGPHVHKAVPARRRVAIVMDNSLRMRTLVAPETTAWQRARETAERLISALGPNDRVALRLTASRAPADWMSPESTRAILDKTRAGTIGHPASGMVRAALALGQDVRVYQIGLGPRRSDHPSRLIRIGVGSETSDNLGWVGFHAGRPIGQKGVTLLGVLASASTKPRSATVRLHSGGRLLGRMTVSVPPLGRREVRFGPVVLEGSQVTLSIVEADCLPDDNQLVARHKPGVRLSVAPRGSLKGLDLLTRLLPEVDPTAPIERTVHVLLGHTPRQLPLPCVTAPPRGSGSGNPGRFGRLSDDPLLRGLDLSDVTVARAIALPLETDGLTPIAWSAEEETPLIARSRKRIALAFWPGPPVTNWPGDASFPVFWRRVIRALFPDAGQFETTIAGPAVTDNRGWLSEDLARLAPVSGRQLARVDLGPLAGMLAAFLLLVYAVVRCKTGRQSSY